MTVSPARHHSPAEAGAGIVVSTENAGLGNRLKSWVSAMRLAPRALVVWPVTPNMPARFSDLFANDCEAEAVPEAASAYSAWRLALLPAHRAQRPARLGPRS